MPFPFDNMEFVATTQNLGGTWNLALILHRTGEIDADQLEIIRQAVKDRLAANRLG